MVQGICRKGENIKGPGSAEAVFDIVEQNDIISMLKAINELSMLKKSRNKIILMRQINDA